MGTTFEYGDVPADLVEQVDSLREQMLEAAAEADDELWTAT